MVTDAAWNMQKLSRRDALRGTGVAALAAGAAVMPFVAKGDQQHASEDLALLALWREYIAVWVKANECQNAYDDANSAAIDAGRDVDIWEFEAVHEGFRNSPHHCAETREMSGALLKGWGVRERRIVPYPEAKTIEQARDLSKARQTAEEAERDRLIRNARRKHRVAALTRENERLHKIPLEIERQMAKAAFIGALGIVIKMGLTFVGDCADPNKEPNTGFFLQRL